MITVRKNVEIDLCHDEVMSLLDDACAFDKLAMMIRFAESITQEDINGIVEFLGEQNMLDSLEPLKELCEKLFKEKTNDA